MDFNSQDAVSTNLLRGEKLLWCAKSSGAKAPQKLIRVLKIPFLIWEGFAMLFIYVGFVKGASGFGMVGTTFMLGGLFIMFKLYREDKRRYKNLIYAITDKRILTVTVGKEGQSEIDTKAQMHLIQSASMACGEDGSGNIIFDLKVCKSEYEMDPEVASSLNYHKQPPYDYSLTYDDRYCTIVYPFEVVSDRVYGGDSPVSIEFLAIDSCKDVFEIFKKANPDFIVSRPPSEFS